MYFVDLVELVVSREQWKQRQYFEKDAANSPNVHFVSIVTICHQALWRTVPTSGDVLSEGWLTVQASAATKICKFDCVSR